MIRHIERDLIKMANLTCHGVVKWHKTQKGLQDNFRIQAIYIAPNVFRANKYDM